jgi:hypothetical protein
MTAFLTGRTGLVAAWLWGFAEGTLFFVVPDVLFTLTLLLSVKRGLWQFGLAVAGALLAGAVMFAWADASRAHARAVVAAVPFVGEKMIAPAEARWDKDGTSGLFRNPLGGVPYKVYAILAPARVSLIEFLAISVPLRVERMLLSLIVFVPLAFWVQRDTNRKRIGFVFHHAFWVLVYAVYWTVNA